MTRSTAPAASMTYMTVDELHGKLTKGSKYHNQPVVVDSIRFDSRKEARRWHNLQLAQQAGEIWNLRRQVRYELHCPGGLKVATYVADFTYARNEQTIVEDVKSVATRKLAMYQLKKRWMAAEYGVEIQEW